MIDLPAIGQLILGRYEVEDIESIGGQAILAKARNIDSAAIVLVKQLALGPLDKNYDAELARFWRAAELRIDHPRVVGAIDCGAEDGCHYMVMPFIEGGHLESYVCSNGGKLAPSTAGLITSQIAEGLESIAHMGVVHRDIKPHNIMMSPEMGAMIIDLGICRVLGQQTLTGGKGMLGTIEYMAPEQAHEPRSVDPRADLYSLGAVMYFMLTGRVPVEGQDAGQQVLHLCQTMPASPAQVIPGIPDHLDRVCMTLLAKLPDERYQSAREVIEVLAGEGRWPATSDPQASSCAACGASAHFGSRFCPRCGASLAAKSSSPRCLACGSALSMSSQCPSCSRTFSHANHRLAFSAGPLAGEVFHIPEGIYVLGRQELAGRDAHISRQHLSVACTNGRVCLQDAGSANKTYVAGRLADCPVELQSGTEIRVASNIAIYTSD